MVLRRGVADARARGRGAQGERLQAALFEQGDAGLDQRLLQVAVVIAPFHDISLLGVNVSAVNFWLDGRRLPGIHVDGVKMEVRMDWKRFSGMAGIARHAGLGGADPCAAAAYRWLGAVPRLAIPLLLSVLYSALMLGRIFFTAEGGFGSLADVRALFASDPLLLAGWVHYLAFDLLIGCFVAERMDRGRGAPGRSRPRCW